MNLGSARYIHLNVTPVGSGPAQDVTIKRSEETKLADGTRLRYVEFNPHFVLDRDRKVRSRRAITRIPPLTSK
jgi:hypothetical protein